MLTSGCRRCTTMRLPWEQLIRLGAYEPPLADWIVSMKFAHQWTWAAWLGDRLSGPVRDTGTTGKVAVTAVPMTWARRVSRGYNQAALMGTALAKRCGWPMAPILRRRHRIPPQTTVTRSQRSANAGRAFVSKRVDLSGWTIWLVDDVKTTGATLRACARQLHAAGASRICVAVAAVTDAAPRAGRTRTTLAQPVSRL